ncbi:hypothetical protein [Parasphingorhabdus pacifica]
MPRLREHLGYISQLIDAPRKTFAAHRHLLVLGGCLPAGPAATPPPTSIALCAARNGRLDEASDAAQTAIESGQVAPSNWWRVREVVNHVSAGKLPAAGELQDSYRTMISR